jgi:hypothetical protein
LRLKSILVLLAILLALGGYFYFSNGSPPPEQEELRVFVWVLEMGEIQHIEVRLPREDESEAFVKISQKGKFPWYFDDLQKSEVDALRWGGGIELLLTGPGAERVIAKNATEEKLAEFGLTQPQMEITLTLEDGEILNIMIGNRTPDGINYYVQAPGSNDVALVDYTWYEVLERLVKEPPYATSLVD